MKAFETPIIETVIFTYEDVITTSSPTGNPNDWSEVVTP